MPTRSSARTVLLFGTVATIICLLWLDRPASTWSYHHLHSIWVFVALPHAAEVIDGAALFALVVRGIAAIFCTFRPGARASLILNTALAVFIALAAREILKYLFGRTWPETFAYNSPSWIKDGAYGFHILHGGEGWTSFPSGHTTAVTAFATALWYQAPRLRILWVLIALLVIFGLYGADFHFLGDISAGATLGILIGQGVVALSPRW